MKFWHTRHVLSLLVISSALVFIVLPVAAQIETVTVPGGNLVEDPDLITPLQNIIKVILSFVGFLALLAIIYGGIKYIISLGDEKGTEQAKHIILYAIVGLIIIALSAVIVNFVLGLPKGQGGNVGGGGGGNKSTPIPSWQE